MRKNETKLETHHPPNTLLALSGNHCSSGRYVYGRNAPNAEKASRLDPPPTQTGIASGDVPAISFTQMLEAAQSRPEAQISDWADIDRIDIRIGKGIAKLQANSGWEIQIDTSNGEVLSAAYRRSDLIEQIHDGSYFSGSVKLYIFLPTGVLLIIMWGSGVYLFLLPRIRRKRTGAKL